MSAKPSGIRQFNSDDFKRFETAKDQHNVMLVVGNGFDISALNHLRSVYRTDYQSFFHYLKSKQFNCENLIFKSMDQLRAKHEADVANGGAGYPDWSDVESRLQEVISYKGLRPEGVYADLVEIQNEFAEFLDLVVNSDMLAKLDREAQDHRWAYRTFARFLADLSHESYQYVNFPNNVGHYHVFNYNVINFNFTSLLDCYLYLDRQQFNPHPYSTVDTNFLFRRNPRDFYYQGGRGANAQTGCSAYLVTQIHHPHGIQAIPRSLLFGVDGEGRAGKRGNNSLEKAFWAQTPLRYERMIEETELFIIFGSSLGATDGWWWRRILHRAHQGADVIIYHYTNPDKSRESAGIAERFIRSYYSPELFGGADLDDQKWNELRMRIQVVNYSNSADLSLLGFGDEVYDPENVDPLRLPSLPSQTA